MKMDIENRKQLIVRRELPRYHSRIQKVGHLDCYFLSFVSRGNYPVMIIAPSCCNKFGMLLFLGIAATNLINTTLPLINYNLTLFCILLFLITVNLMLVLKIYAGNCGIPKYIFERHNRKHFPQADEHSIREQEIKERDKKLELMVRQNKNEPNHKKRKIDYCEKCDVFKNEFKSMVKHCNYCGLCIENWDHHCGVFGKCVTVSNCWVLGSAIGMYTLLNIVIYVCNGVYESQGRI